MKIKKRDYIRCPRCNCKNHINAKVCMNCELNFSKFNQATNAEGKKAVKHGEKDRVLWTKQLPVDVSKWKLFFLTLFFGWTGMHLWKTGRINRAITHTFALISFIISYVIFINEWNNVFAYNAKFILGSFGLITISIVICDIIEIAFNLFKVPVSLPYKEKK